MYFIYKTTASFSQNLSKKILNFYPNPLISKLESRTLIKIEGKETKKYLQGIMTNNIQILDKEKSQKVSLYTIFMNPKGKVITDAFIMRPNLSKEKANENDENELWVDVSKSQSDVLFSHLKKYTWKKDVKLTNEGNFNFYAIYGDFLNGDKDGMEGSMLPIFDENDLTQQHNKQENSLSFIDPRGAQFGIRVVSKEQNLGESKNLKAENDYQKFNTLQGASSNNSMQNKIPFMFNSDLFNGFSFNKGCYLGQELIARSYNTGIIRRRVFPYILEDSNAVLEEGKSLKGINGLDIGKVLESYPGYGTVIINYLSLLDKEWPLKIEGDVKGLVQIPFKDQLLKYIADIKSKQARLEEIDL